MIVNVETNFVVEVALEQEEYGEASAIIALAEKGDVELAFPNFILAESFELLKKGHNKRNSAQSSLVTVLNQLQRSEPHKQIMLDLGPIISVLQTSQDRELANWHSTRDRIIDVGKCLEMKIGSIKEAQKYQKTLALSPKDSIIYSTIIADLRTRSMDEKKCFLSRDKRAFDKNDDHRIKAELETYNCEYEGSFYGGLMFIQHQLQNN